MKNKSETTGFLLVLHLVPAALRGMRVDTLPDLVPAFAQDAENPH
jgi:hypothetical protein